VSTVVHHDDKVFIPPAKAVADVRQVITKPGQHPDVRVQYLLAYQKALLADHALGTKAFRDEFLEKVPELAKLTNNGIELGATTTSFEAPVNTVAYEGEPVVRIRQRVKSPTCLVVYRVEPDVEKAIDDLFGRACVELGTKVLESADNW
jgi:hypothetical protein